MSKLSETIALTRTQWLMLVVALVYVISPVDIIPELFTGPIGLTDDMAAMALIGTTALGGWKAAKAGKQGQSPGAARVATRSPGPAAPPPPPAPRLLHRADPSG